MTTIQPIILLNLDDHIHLYYCTHVTIVMSLMKICPTLQSVMATKVCSFQFFSYLGICRSTKRSLYEAITRQIVLRKPLQPQSINSRKSWTEIVQSVPHILKYLALELAMPAFFAQTNFPSVPNFQVLCLLKQVSYECGRAMQTA